ncbi:hypothetical protein FRB90_008154, partial [Tulasnella sp. 427]
MKLFTLYVIPLSLISSLAYATAISQVSSGNETLAKRGNEVNFLANCVHYHNTAFPNDNYHVSHMIWYSDVDNSFNGQ